jgi:hypothetical protein
VLALFNDKKAQLVAQARRLGIDVEKVLSAAAGYKVAFKLVDPLEALAGEIEMYKMANRFHKIGQSVRGL